MHAANQWPSEEVLPGYRGSVEAFLREMREASDLVMRG
jgi:isopenicillin N synthase-like dioxygenase